MCAAKVTIDGEWLLAKFQEIEYIIDEIRARCGDGAFVAGADQTRPDPRTRTQDGTPIFPAPRAAIGDLSEIEWKIKGSEPARVNDSWAWAFAYESNGDYRPESRDLVMAIEAAGKIKVGIYEITLSGRDKNLLSRTIPKAGGRKGR